MLRTVSRTPTSNTTTGSRVVHVDSSNYKIIRQEIFSRNVIAAKCAMPIAEYIKTFKTTRDPRPMDPGPRPILPTLTNDAKRKKYQLKWDAWKWDSERFKENETLRAALKEDILTTLPESFVKSITDPDLGIMHLTDEECLNLADKEFGTISPAALALLKQSLPKEIAKTAEEIKELANKQRNYYAVAKSAGEETGENEKVSNFMNLMHESLSMHKIIFNKTYKSIGDRKFETAVNEMVEAAEEISLDSNMSANFVLVTKPTSVPTNYNEYMANAAAAATAAGFTKPKRSNDGRNNYIRKNSTRAPSTSIDPSTLSYCWSHGPNRSHDSQSCREPHPNHDTTATFTNQKGGRRNIWRTGETVGP